MKFHIVRDGETVREIMFLYSITEDELKEENRHIRSWDRLIPGTKLKISTLCEADDNDILQMEPFIEDYYPKDIKLDDEVEKEKKLEPEENIQEEITFNNSNDQLEETDQVTPNEEPKEQNILEIKEDTIDYDNQIKEVYINKPRMCNKQKRNIIYYPYYVYYPIYSPYYFNFKKGR